MKQFLLITILFFASNLYAADYYISSSTGDNSNDGLTPETAWKSLWKVSYGNFNPGDAIHFKRGDIWKGYTLLIRAIGTESDPVIYTDYGNSEDALPEISVLDTFPDDVTWTDEGSNIWSIVVDYYELGIPEWSNYHNLRRMLIDGQEVLSAAISIASELGKSIPDLVRFHYEKSNQLLKIYSTTSPENLDIEISFRQYAIKFENSGQGTPQYIIVENLKTKGGNVAALELPEGEHITVRNIDVGEYAKIGIILSSKAQHIIFDNCTIDSRYTFDYSGAGTATGTSDRGPREGFYCRGADYIEFKNSFVKNFTHANINFGLDSYGDFSEHNKVHDNYICSPDIAYGGRIAIERGTRDLELYNNTIDGSAVQNQISGQNNHYHHNIFKNVRSTPLKDWHTGYGIYLSPYGNEDIINNIFENNIFIDCESGAIFLACYPEYLVENNIFRNNILINNGKKVGSFISRPGHSPTSNINVAIQIEDQYDSWTGTPIVTGNNTFQNNLMYVTDGDVIIQYHCTDNYCYDPIPISVEEFNTKNGENDDVISDNMETDPLFVDFTNNNFHLQDGSPAIDAGVATLVTKDFVGNTIPFGNTNPDIGIYESGYVVGINQLSGTGKITIYPNPASNEIFIGNNLSKEIKEISICDITGKLVYSRIVNRRDNNDIMINISHLKRGLYVISVQTAKYNYIKKIVKK